MRPGPLVRVLVLLGILPPALGTVTGAERPLTLDEATALAIEKNQGLFIERESLAAARAAVTGAKGAYDPVLELTSGWRRASDPINSAFSGAPEGRVAPTTRASDAGVSVRQLLPTGGSLSFQATAIREKTDGAFALLSPAYRTQVGVELRQPLLRNRTVDAARFTVRAAVSDREGAVASLRRTITETVAEVERAYWKLAASRLEVGVREEALRLAEEQLAETRKRIESGVAPETEIAQPRAELERRRGEFLTSRESASRAENDLKLLILGDAADPLWMEQLAPADDVAMEVVAVDVPASLERALASRPELKTAKAVVGRRRAESAFARDGIRPALDATVSYDRLGLAGSRNPAGSSLTGLPVELPPGLEGGLGQSFETLREGDFDDVRASVVFAIPIGNRTARAAAARAGSFEQQAEADLRRIGETVKAEILDAAAALETAGQRIEAARAGRRAAEVQLAAERERYAVGFSTNFLVLTRQNDLARARLDEISALTAYRNARTEMARATGSLLEERRIAVDRTGS